MTQDQNCLLVKTKRKKWISLIRVLKFKFNSTGLLNLLEYFERSRQVIVWYKLLHHLAIQFIHRFQISQFWTQSTKDRHATLFPVHWWQWVFTFPVEGTYCPGDRKYCPQDSEFGPSWILCSFVASFSFSAFKMSPALVSFAQSSVLRKWLSLGCPSRWGMKTASASGFGDRS